MAITNSKARLQVSQLLFSWTIDNFSSCKQKLTSEQFSVSGKDDSKWYITLHPFGNGTNEDDGYISIFLGYNLTTVDHMHSLFKFSLHDKNGKCLIEVFRTYNFRTHLISSYGYPKFCKRDEILHLLEGDVLDVRCWIKWETDIMVGEKVNALKETNKFGQLSYDYEKLLNQGSFSDICLKANDGTKFSAHKCVLASRSPVFSAMFKHNLEENQESEVSIKDFDGKTLKAMLYFIYSECIKEDELEFDKVFMIAHKYLMEELQLWSEYKLIKNLNIKNAAYYLQLSEQYNVRNLKGQSLIFISDHLNSVLKTDAFQNLKTSHPYLLEEILQNLSEKLNKK